VGLKLVPLPVALLFCALWPRLAPRFVAVLAAGVLLPFLTRPAAQVVEQYHGLAEQSRGLSAERWPGFRDLWTAGLVLGRLAEGKTGLPDLKAPLTSRPYRGLQCAGGLAVLVLCWRLGHRRHTPGARARLGRPDPAMVGRLSASATATARRCRLSGRLAGRTGGAQPEGRLGLYGVVPVR